MKDILESGKVFELHAQIDCCYWLISEANKELSKHRSPIKSAIDKVTGYEAAQVIKIRESVIEYLGQIIDCKKKIDADYSGDEVTMNKLIEMKSK